MKLKDKIALITGGSRGLGKEIARQFLLEGAAVIITATSEENLRQAAAELGPLGKIEAVPMDVSQFAAVQETVAKLIGKYGRIDILVNNAGISAGERGSGAALRSSEQSTTTSGAVISDMTEERFDKVIAVNLKGTFACARAVAGSMAEHGYGRIINMSSATAHNGSYGQTNYAAAKAAIIAMTQTWAKELGKKGVTVNAVAPGYTWTDMISGAPAETFELIKKRTPVGRLGTPEDIAAACVYLASEEAGFVNGAVLRANGGLVV